MVNTIALHKVETHGTQSHGTHGIVGQHKPNTKLKLVKVEFELVIAH